MIVYGDGTRRDDPRALVRGLLADCSAAERAINARDASTRLVVGASELVQGLVDHAFHARGDVDDLGPLERLGARLTLAAARALLQDGPLVRPRAAEVARVLHELLRADLPAEIEVRVPEGYVHYGLSPLAYADAARARRGPPLVAIGLRSIGAGLAAVVAAASASPAPPVTLRPVGHPFAREVRLGPALERWLLSAPAGTCYAVVDEGPGLSGSSLNAVADWLEARGVSPDRIVFFPHHAGELGPQASARHRERWSRAERHIAAFDPATLLGVPQVEDLSGGRWRAHLYRDEAAWPAIDPRGERLKYLARDGRRARLFKFAGLGRYGDAAQVRAKVLAESDLGAPVLGLVRGFLVQPWLEGARPLDALAGDGVGFERRDLVNALTSYVRLVARGLPGAPTGPGATPRALLAMARHNAELALGAAGGGALGRWRAVLPRLEGAARPVAVDGRMHAWEWLVLEDGRVLKTDALDHHAGHDLIGRQDVAWDVAGATVELDLDPEERARLAQAAGRRDESILRFYEDCYLAFHLGRCTLAARAASGGDVARLEAAAARYAARLACSLGGCASPAPRAA